MQLIKSEHNHVLHELTYSALTGIQYINNQLTLSISTTHIKLCTILEMEDTREDTTSMYSQTTFVEMEKEGLISVLPRIYAMKTANGFIGTLENTGVLMQDVCNEYKNLLYSAHIIDLCSKIEGLEISVWLGKEPSLYRGVSSVELCSSDLISLTLDLNYNLSETYTIMKEHPLKIVMGAVHKIGKYGIYKINEDYCIGTSYGVAGFTLIRDTKDVRYYELLYRKYSRLTEHIRDVVFPVHSANILKIMFADGKVELNEKYRDNEKLNTIKGLLNSKDYSTLCKLDVSDVQEHILIKDIELENGNVCIIRYNRWFIEIRDKKTGNIPSKEQYRELNDKLKLMEGLLGI